MNLAVMYHYVREPEDWKGSVPISPKEFESQIDRLGKTHDFVLPDELNNKTAKPKCILTFDDATRDQYEYAFDIMRRKGVPGYFTVMSGPLAEQEVPVFHLVHAALSLVEENHLWDELRPHLTAEDLLKLRKADATYAYEKSSIRKWIKYTLNFILDAKQSKNILEHLVYSLIGSKQKFIDDMYIGVEEFRIMKQAGMTLGVHSVYHAPFDGDVQAYFTNEIAPCVQFMQEQLNIKPSWYTPPFGGGEKKELMKENLKDLLLPCGFKGAFTTERGMIEDTGSFWYKRIDCNELTELTL
ncbi:polysaccharide deacetylase [Paenibacillus nanensis]|uniref:Polysaccharide deacetylase n=1 Tax=Paenibacillus nanensis TaxID=393251 RepID=A0A3A1UKY3_9BACL|nr:polysaccharide deacetylase family protein [Paenibacillus nanensis]RIX47319.1 polysaccharide deacetylase [Paenibacillus nanensis]